MSEIFISYRREDAPAHAGRLYDGLIEEFGAQQVFMDVDTLEPGVDFVERLHSAVGTADAVLVVIGRGWLNASNLDGERRLDDPEDFVRLEVGLALTGAPVVIPVLVGGATMPSEDDLPPELVQLARRNALTMIDSDWRSGLARLVAALRRIVDPVAEPGAKAGVPAEPDGQTRAEPVEAPALAPVPLVATALALAGAAGLLIGTFMQVDFWAHPGDGTRWANLGYFSSLAPMGLVVGALGSLGLSYSRSAGRIATGLFLGFALAGVARYVSLLGTWRNTEEVEDSAWSQGAALALIGCLVLVAAAVVRLRADREDAGAAAGVLPVALVIAGAVLVVAGTVLPFNEGPVPKDNDLTTIVSRDGGWWAVETIGAALLAVGASFLLGRRRSAASGVLIGIGTFLVLLFAGRYIGYVWWQPNDISEVAAGGFVGLAGGAAILAGGLVARPRGRRA
ncbi:MAG: toll/interleukin-1 receptor domain-containing protein [Gaiellaceae bacterium]|jgi:TIR domain